MSKVWITSDSHFGHLNIIKYCNRPFDNVETMNETIIKNWNNTVSKDDLVFHLGDVVFGRNAKETLKEIVPQLNGKKILIRGNHDRFKVSDYIEAGFHTVYDYPILYDGFFLLSHEPLFISDAMPYVNIHGHLHDKSYDSKQHVNVSIECTNYKPIEFKVIKKKFEEE